MQPFFSRLLPPITQTFCPSADRPCVFQPDAGASLAGTLESPLSCPYRDECEATSKLAPLWRAFGSHVRVTLVEPSANLVVRAEQQVHQLERHRVSLRRHLYETTSDLTPFCHLSPKSQTVLQSDLHHTLNTAFVQHGYAGHKAGAAVLKVAASTADEAIQYLKSLPAETLPIRWTEFVVGFWDINKTALDLAIRIAALENSIAPGTADVFARHIHRKIFDVLRRNLTRPFACKPLSGEQLGTYLGFVDVRHPTAQSPVALAVLRPPRHIRRNPRARVILGEYGQFFGGPSYPCSVFSMHDSTTSGAYCAQACTFMALSMLADRGARIHSALDISLLKHEISELGNQPREITIGGSTLEEVKVAFEKSDASASIFLRSTVNDKSVTERWFSRLISAYINARFPIIVFVDANIWKGERRPSGGSRGSHELLHAVTLVGYIRSHDGSRSLRSVVVHDPSFAPFSVMPLNHLIHASQSANYGAGKSCTTQDIPAVFCTSKAVDVHAIQALSRIASTFRGKQYLVKAATEDADFFVRLGRGSDLPQILGSSAIDFQSIKRYQLVQSHSKNPESKEDETMLGYARQQIKFFDTVERWVRRKQLSTTLCWFICGTQGSKVREIWAVPAKTSLIAGARLVPNDLEPLRLW